MTTALEGGEGSASRPGRSLPLGKTLYPLYRRLGGPQGRYGEVRKISPPTGIRSPDRPARSQSIYQLRLPGPHVCGKDNGKCHPITYHKRTKGGGEVQLCSLFNVGERWAGWSTLRPERFTPGKETRHTLYRKLDGPHDLWGWVRKMSPAPGYDARTVQHVVSRYTELSRATNPEGDNIKKKLRLEDYLLRCDALWKWRQ